MSQTFISDLSLPINLCTKKLDSLTHGSILTSLTPNLSRTNSFEEPICIQLYKESESAIIANNSYDFKPNLENKFFDYYEKVEDGTVIGYKNYTRKCHKNGLPPVNAVRDTLSGNQILNLCSYGCGTIGIQLICEFLSDPPLSKLTHLDLSNCQFDEFACDTLNHFMQRSLKLEHLNLCNCLIGTKGAEKISEGLQLSQSISILNLSRNDIKDDGGVSIAKAMCYNIYCKDLDLSHNRLYCKSGEALGEMLDDNTTLRTLELGWNDLYPEEHAIVPILNGLFKNTGLTKLGLSWNGLKGDLFSKALRRAIIASQTLEILDIQNNRLQSSDVKPIAFAFKKATVLHSVYLGGNSFTNSDIEFFIKVFNVNPPLRLMSLGNDIWITPEATRLARLVKEKNNLTQIIYKGTLLNNPPNKVNFRNIIINRIKFLAQKPKKPRLKRNMGHLMLQFKEAEQKFVTRDEFLDLLAIFNAKLDEDVISHLMDEFTVELVTTVTKKRISLEEMADYYLKMHPTELPPPLPEKKIHKEKEIPKSKTKGNKK